VKHKNFFETQFKNAGILPYTEAFKQVSGKFCFPKPILLYEKPPLAVYGFFVRIASIFAV